MSHMWRRPNSNGLAATLLHEASWRCSAFGHGETARIRQLVTNHGRMMSSLSQPTTQSRTPPKAIAAAATTPFNKSKRKSASKRHYCSFYVPPQERTRRLMSSNRNRFLLKVHPDLFSGRPDLQEVNSRSLKLLNSLLHSVNNPASAPSSFPHRAEELRFFFRSSSSSSSPPSDQPQPQAQHQQEFMEAKTVFTPPKKPLHEASSSSSSASSLHKLLSQEIRRCLTELYEQVGLISPSAPSSAEQQREKMQAEEEERRRRAKEMLLHQHRLARMYKGGYVPIEHLTPQQKDQKLIDMIRGRSTEYFVGNAYWESQLQADMVFFRDNLATEQKERGLRKLRRELRHLSFHSWCHLPIIMGKHYSRHPAGFVVMPYDFKREELIYHLRQHLDKISAERKAIREEAEQFVELRRSLRDSLHLKDLSVHGRLSTRRAVAMPSAHAAVVGSREGAIAALKRLQRSLPLLKQYDWSNTNLVLFHHEEEPQEAIPLLQQFSVDERTRRLFVPRNFREQDLVTFLQTHVHKAAPWISLRSSSSSSTQSSHTDSSYSSASAHSAPAYAPSSPPHPPPPPNL
ncbi:hypothetical protein QOT17_019146 [Balamuthia mandrillaris]